MTKRKISNEVFKRLIEDYNIKWNVNTLVDNFYKDKRVS